MPHLLKNTAWLFLGELIGRLIRFWLVIYAARVLGAEEYGIFSYILSIAAFATILSDIGLSALMTRETSRAPELRQQYFNALCAVKVILIAITSIGIALFVRYGTGIEALTPFIVIIISMFGFDSLREFGFGVQRGLEQMKREGLTKIFMNLLITIFGFVALEMSSSVYALSIGYAFGAGIGCVLTVILLRNFFRHITDGINWKLIIPLIKLAWPIGLLQLLGAIMINTDMVMLGWWQDAASLGYYGAAQKVILLLYILPSIIASGIFPRFAQLAHHSNEEFRSLFERSIIACELLALPLALGGALLAPQIIELLFGAAYLPASLALALLMITLVIVFPSTIFSNALFAYNKQKTFIWFVMIGAGLNIAMNWILIPNFGIEGAAVATIISQVVANALIWRTMSKTNNYQILSRLTPGLIAGVVMSSICLVTTRMNLPILLIILLSAVSYGATLILLKEPITYALLKRLR